MDHLQQAANIARSVSPGTWRLISTVLLAFGVASGACGRAAAATEPDTARAEAQSAIDALNRSLAQHPERRAAWEAYLELPALSAALASREPMELSLLATVMARTGATNPALAWAPVARLHRAVANYLQAELSADAAARLPEWIEHFAAPYRAATDTEVEAARQRLWWAMDALDRSLSGNRDYRSGWKRHVQWNALVPQVQVGAESDISLLRQIAARFRTGNVGLERPEFVEAAAALTQFADLYRSAHDPEMAEQYRQQLQVLAAELRKPRPERQVAAVAQAVAWLAQYGQAAEVVRAVRALYDQPNLVVEVSADFITRVGTRAIDTTEPVRDVILGTQIFGTGRTIGRVQMRLVEDPDRAVIEAVMQAVNYSRSRGYNGPAIVHSRGQTELEGRVRLSITDQQIVATPAVAEAKVHSQIVGTGSSRGGLIGKIVSKAAARRAPQQKAAGERVAERHAQERLIRRLNEQFAEALLQANQRLAERVRAPLVRHGNYPDYLHFSTRRDALIVTAREESARGLGAGDNAPPLAGRPALSVRVHQSLINNAAFDWLAGQRRSTREVQSLVEELLQRPVQLESDQPVPDVHITFAADEPIRFTADNDLLTVTLRGDRYEVPDRADIVQWDITAQYRLERIEGGGFRAQRTGPLQAYPRDFQPGQQLDLRRQLMRSALMRLMTPRFKETIDMPPIQFQGEMRQHGPLTLEQAEARNGWILLGWTAPRQ